MQIHECVRWLWKSARSFQLPMACCALVGMLQAGVSLYFVYVCKHLIDIATGASDDRLYLFIGLLVGCMLMQLLLSACRSRWVGRTEIRLRNRLRNQLFIRLMETSWMGRESLHTGDVLNRLEEDVSTVTDALCRTVPSVAVTLFQLLGALWFLSQLDSRLTGVLIFIMPLCLLFSKTYVRKMRRMSREIREEDSRIQICLQEHLQHRVLIRTLEYTSQAIRRLNTLQLSLQKRVISRIGFSVFSRTMVQFGFASGYASAFLWGVFGLQDGTVTFGMMAAFLQLVSQIQRPMVSLSQQIPSFIQVFTAAERLDELMKLPLEQQGDPVRLEGGVGIRVEGLDFTYPAGQRKVLSAFTHDFRPGSLTAIVGETGVGKSTLIRLVLALLRPDKGSIVFYNDRQEAVASPLTRCNLSYVPQGNTLLSGTVRNNLLMGNPQATEDMLWNALYTAAADFVYALPDGLETVCGERGTGLSEGQAQRIAIARALLRPGGILLLDEPTSSLDNETEQLLLNRLSAQIAGKTLILITHREAIAGLCTEVVRME